MWRNEYITTAALLVDGQVLYWPKEVRKDHLSRLDRKPLIDEGGIG